MVERLKAERAEFLGDFASLSDEIVAASSLTLVASGNESLSQGL